MKIKNKWYNSLWLTVSLVVIFFAAAFYLRVALPYSNVFVGDWIKFTTVDAYYFMRQIDNLVHNFPHFLAFDPYQTFPSGLVLGGQNMFVYFVSGIIWVVGLGSPNQHTIDIVSAYLPAFLGAISVVPVYFIGKTLFNRGTGLISAALIAITPGEFLGRTILGNNDRDPFEVILTALTMLFLILAIKSAAEMKIAFNDLVNRKISLWSRPLIYSLISGILLGTYTLTWRGSFLFVLILLAYFVIQSIINQFKKQSSEYLGFVAIITLLITLVIFVLGARISLMIAALTLSFLGTVVFTLIAWALNNKKMQPIFYPLAMVVIALAGLGLFYALKPALFSDMMSQFSVFFPSGSFLTVSQMQPILYPAGQFSIIPVWGNFTTGIFLIFISLIILIYLAFKRREPDKILFLVWSIILLVATLLTRRIALLFALNVALLVGYLGWQIISFMIARTSPSAVIPETPIRPVSKKKSGAREIKRVRAGFLASNRIVVLSITAIAVFFLVFYPDISPATDAATYAGSNTPSNNWYQALTWLKDNTPEPLGDASTYTQYYSKPQPYPASAYGILAWWDFGYWIIRIGHRMPVNDPGGGPREQVAQMLTSQNETAANNIMDQLGAKYVIIDDTTIGSKFGGVVSYAGTTLSQFGEVYYSNSGGRLNPITYYYPAYFQNAGVRLYRFDGKKVTPTTITVISYLEKISKEGTHYAEIASTNNFSTYDEAKGFLDKQKTGNYRIVSASSNQSPVPLEAMSKYTEIYSPNPTDPTSVKIFQYAR